MFTDMSIEEILIKAVAVLLAFSVHEAAHAFSAYWLGDLTQKSLGRLTLNPIKHIDPIGFVMILLFNFGWAKPVRFNPEHFKKPDRDILIVALAGPFSNFVFACLSFGILKLMTLFVIGPIVVWGYLILFINFLAQMNIVLFIFNLIPLPPLDGSAVLLNAIPNDKLHWKIAAVRYGPWLLLLLIILDYFSNANILTTIFVNLVRVFAKVFGLPGYT
jgi:Zn-dependent protease